MPALDPSHIVGSVSYTDGQFDDARYTIALIESMAEAGGEALNYARVVRFEKNSGGKLTGVEVEDQLSQARFTVRARAFVNATGPWSDSIRQLATVGAKPRMRLSKGVHILLPLEVLQSRDALLIPKTEDGRVLFALPWFDRLLVGTTEKELTDHEELYVTRDEVDYLLRHLNRYLTAPVGREQVVSAFVGVRPLLSAGKSGDTQSLSRDYEVEVDQLSGLISVMGGKWTTYRAMAEDTINVVQEFIGDPVTSSATGQYLLSGARGWNPEYWRSLIREYGVPQPAAQHLVQKFGTHASRVLALTRLDPNLGLLLLDGFPTLRAEVLYAARYEMATTIEDVLLRRSGLQLLSWTGAIAAAPLTASILAEELNWNPEFTRTSIERYVKKINHLISTAGLAGQYRLRLMYGVVGSSLGRRIEMTAYLGAIDQGTTSTRFIVFDRSGRIISVAQKEHEQIYPNPGWVEHDPEEIWHRTREVIHAGMQQAGLHARDLAAIGITNQRETTVVWNRKTGRPVYNALVWQDTRVEDAVAEFSANGGQDRFRKKTGLPLATYFSGLKIRWILDHVEGARKQAEAGDLLFGTIDTFLLWNLTGGSENGDSRHRRDEC